MNSSYIEAIAFAKPNADRGAIANWLVEKGFQNVSPMQVGIYFGGSPQEFESVFNVDINKPSSTWNLKVPHAVQSDVEHFEIAAPPQYHV